MDLGLKEKIAGKKVGILGFGREGRATLKRVLLAGSYSEITVYDLKDVSADLPENVKLVCGETYLDRIEESDIVFKTPGVVLPKGPSEYKCDINSQMEIFIERFASQIIGITGTKGKSTTSSLLFHVLKSAGKDVIFAGNIGIPVFDIADDINENTIIVVEISCHQLEYTEVSPKRAVLLNIYEDHLDHYGTRLKYGLAKKNIYKYQKDTDTLYSTKETIDEWGEGEGNIVYPAITDLPFASFEEIGASLKGTHNLLNTAFVYDICKDFEVCDETFIKAVASFETLPHRLEYVGKIGGVDYYDDSISTTVKSTISAVKSIDNAAVLLIGGMERNIDYTELASFLIGSKIKHIICMYESGERFYKMLKEQGVDDNINASHLVSDLESAVKLSKTLATENDAVLLSPAAASYGYFKNFEERGDEFKRMVKS